MKTTILRWAWQENIPLAQAMQAASKIKKCKVWVADEDRDTYCIILAPTKKEAKAAWMKENADMLKDAWKTWQTLQDKEQTIRAFHFAVLPDIYLCPKDWPND